MNKTVRLGMFIFATLLILATGIFLIGDRESKFSSTYRVKAEFANVAGLNTGADVRVGGIRTGSVSRIDLPKRPDGKVTVVMNLKSSTRDIVRKDSVAAIRSEGLLGDEYVEVSFGSDNAARLNSGDQIEGEPPFEISALMKKTDQILDTAQGALTSIQQTASNFSSISGKINTGQGTVGALINDKTIYKQAAASATELQEDMEALKHNFLLRGFFKNRGYEDSSDLTKNEISQLPGGPALKIFRYDARKLFDKPDTAKLKDEKALNDAGKFLETARFSLAVIVASAGMKGDTEAQRKLTQGRSLAVREYLVKNFKLEDTRLKTIGMGKTEDTSSDGRLEIVVYPIATGQRTPPGDR